VFTSGGGFCAHKACELSCPAKESLSKPKSGAAVNIKIKDNWLL
jgi:hypothetical protein